MRAAAAFGIGGVRFVMIVEREDFIALMEVVQEEAEGAFIDTAATMHGVRAGARSLTHDRRDDDLLHDPSTDGEARELPLGSAEPGEERLAFENR